MANIKFPNMFDVSSGKVALVYGNDAVRQSLKCQILSNLNELLGDPLFGSTIKSLLFEPYNAFFQTRLNQRLQYISNKFNEITIKSDKTSVKQRAGGRVEITIVYEYNITNKEDSITLSTTPSGQVIAI